MIAVVTGASGFIGTHLVVRLKSDGIEVVKIPHNTLKDREYLSECLHKINPQYIFHLSAYGNMSNQKDEDETINANYLNTYNLLQATKDIPYTLFLNVSTSSVYGKSYTTMRETQRLRPDTLYAATKAGAEYLCRYFRKKYKKVIVTVRPFSVYGPGEASFRFIPTLLKNKKEGLKTNIIRGVHDWIYIDDLINGIMKIVENVGYLPHRTYNIGTGVMTSNTNVADMIVDNYIATDDTKIQDSDVWVADCERLKDLNWAPAVSIQKGIFLTSNYESTT